MKAIHPTELSDSGEEEEMVQEAKRRPGRPTTTVDYSELAEAKECLNKAMGREVELLFMKRVFQGEVDPKEGGPSEDDKLAAEIRVELLRQLESVGAVAKQAKTLKGTSRKALKAVYRISRMAVAELAARFEGVSSPAASNKEWERREEEYKKEIASLRDELARRDRGSLEEELSGERRVWGNNNVSLEVLHTYAQYSGSPLTGARKKRKRKTTPSLKRNVSPDIYVGRNDLLVEIEDGYLPEDALPPAGGKRRTRRDGR